MDLAVRSLQYATLLRNLSKPLRISQFRALAFQHPARRSARALARPVQRRAPSERAQNALQGREGGDGAGQI
jgi:hypothetical protein